MIIDYDILYMGEKMSAIIFVKNRAVRVTKSMSKGLNESKSKVKVALLLCLDTSAFCMHSNFKE